MAEKEYIEREEALDALYENEYQTLCPLDEVSGVINAIPAADVVEVVRCKDCVHSCFIRSCSKYECRKGFAALKFSNDFCSYGERRKDELSKATDS